MGNTCCCVLVPSHKSSRARRPTYYTVHVWRHHTPGDVARVRMRKEMSRSVGKRWVRGGDRGSGGTQAAWPGDRVDSAQRLDTMTFLHACLSAPLCSGKRLYMLTQTSDAPALSSWRVNITSRTPSVRWQAARLSSSSWILWWQRSSDG